MASKKRKLGDGGGEGDQPEDSAARSPSPSAINGSSKESNPLLQLTSYDDEDEEDADMDFRTRTGDNGRGGGRNGWRKGDGEEDDEFSEEEDRASGPSTGRSRRQVEVRRDCPYLDTVNRQVLDFDFEKFCSVSLSNLNVYACLVCGKYYQGRGQKSHAYTHSLEADHHVYINLQTERVYCLPDGYEIMDPSLDDIRHVLNPSFLKCCWDHSLAKTLGKGI